MRLRASWIFLLTFLLPNTAWAFKVGTHVWVAQDVINRLEQCDSEEDQPCVHIPFDDVARTMPVPAEARDAILNEKAYYRMGNIGPDAFPDMLVGQSVIHPGITDDHSGHETISGFGTSDWLAHLMKKAGEIPDAAARRQALAFVYGFLGHAAADVFAHTYVNTYVGDIFSLDDGNTEAELRHVLLEDYIQKKTPDLEDSQGNPLVDVSALLQAGDGAAIPVEFIRQSLIFDPVAQNELKKAPATAGHLVAVVDLYEEIKRALVELPSGMSNVDYARSLAKSYYDAYSRDTADDSTAAEIFKIVQDKYESDAPQGGSIQQAEIVAVQVVAYYYFKVQLDAKQAAKTAELLNGFMAYQAQAIGQWNDKRHDIDQKALQMYQRASAAGINAVAIAGGSKPLAAITDARARFAQSLDRYRNAAETQRQTIVERDNAKRAMVAQQAARLCQILPQSSCERIEDRLTSVSQICEKCVASIRGRCLRRERYPCIVDVLKPTSFLDPACINNRNTCENVHAAHNRAVTNLQNALASAEAKLRQGETSVVNELTSTRNEFDALKQLMVSTQRAIESSVQTLKALESNLIAAALALSEGHRSIVKEWAGDIEHGMREYVRANGQAILNSFDGNDETSVLKPLADWKSCYLPSIVGVAQEVMDATACAAIDLKAKYDALHAQLEAEVRRFDPVVAETVLAARDRFRNALAFHAARSASIAFNMLLAKDNNLRMTAHVLMNDVERSHLNQQFAADQSADNLPIYKAALGSIADRVDADMQAPGDEKFVSKNFATAYNATIFAALALLDNEGINQLGQTGLMNYSVQSTTLSNLLTKSLRSIDGNHQWMSIAPPFVRRGGVVSDPKWEVSRTDPTNVDRRFSWRDGTRESGFPLFMIYLPRIEIFNLIFKGPLNPGLFESADYGFANLVPGGYDYLPSQANPFPIASRSW